MREPKQRTSEIPHALNQRFGAIVKARGLPSRSTVLYHLLADAAALVVAGRGDLLPKAPPSGRQPRGSLGKLDEVRWTQGLAEFTDWRLLFESVGSSVSEVIRAGVSAWVEAGGDSARMSWAAKRDVDVAA